MLKELSEEEKRKLIAEVNKQYSVDLSLEGNFFSKKEKHNTTKIFYYTGSRIPRLPVDWVGSHLFTIDSSGVILPSIEGAQKIAETTEKFINVPEDDAEEIMAGRDIKSNERHEEGYYILKSGDLVLGVCKAVGDTLLSLIPKSRRTFKQYK